MIRYVARSEEKINAVLLLPSELIDIRVSKSLSKTNSIYKVSLNKADLNEREVHLCSTERIKSGAYSTNGRGTGGYPDLDALSSIR